MRTVGLQLAAFAAAFAAALLLDRRAAACGCMGEVLYHPRPAVALWGSVLLIAALLLALAAWTRLAATGVGAAVAVGGAASNALVQLGRPGVPDYLQPPWPAIVVSAGDIAIWLGLAVAVASVCAHALAHVRRGGRLADDVRASRPPGYFPRIKRGRQAVAGPRGK